MPKSVVTLELGPTDIKIIGSNSAFSYARNQNLNNITL